MKKYIIRHFAPYSKIWKESHHISEESARRMFNFYVNCKTPVTIEVSF